MSVTNNNLQVIDLPVWEQQTPATAASATGVCNVTDQRGNNRYIYQLLSAASFWRYCTWSATWQQLPSPPGGTFGAGTCMIFDPGYGTTTKGSIWAIIANATAPVFYNFDIGSNTWSSAKSITNLPATVGTDADLCKIDPAYNLNMQTGSSTYTGVSTVTLSAGASLGATTLSVNALPAAMAANTILNFGTISAPLWAITTAAAAASATSLTVAALPQAITGTPSAYWTDKIYFVGNAATTMIQYSISGNSWANSTGTIPGAVGAGNGLFWLPGYDPDKLILVRGAATANIYQYSMSAATWSTLTFMPTTETFTTGTHTMARSNPFVTGAGAGTSGITAYASLQNRLLVQMNATGKIYEFDPIGLQLQPIATNWMFTDGAAVIGNRLNYIVASGIEFVYFQLHTSATFIRVGLNSQF